MIPATEDPPPLKDTLYEIWQCEECGALTRTDEYGDKMLTKCTCDHPTSGTFLGWAVRGGALIVWYEERREPAV